VEHLQLLEIQDTAETEDFPAAEGVVERLLLIVLEIQAQAALVAVAQQSSQPTSNMPRKSTSLSVGRGEKLPVSKGAGLTAKGRAKYNRATGSNLKAPAPNPKTKADAGRKKSFCARMAGVVAKAKGPAERAKASMRRWKC
jgi:hypothetical protein